MQNFLLWLGFLCRGHMFIAKYFQWFIIHGDNGYQVHGHEWRFSLKMIRVRQSIHSIGRVKHDQLRATWKWSFQRLITCLFHYWVTQ